MKFEKVLVTGTGGQLGSYTAAELKGLCEVHGFDAKGARGDFPHRVGDITDPVAMARACKGMDAVIHIAARPNIWSGTGDDIVRVNTMGVWTVLTAAEAAGVRRVVLCSSDSVVGFTVMSAGLKPPEYLPIDAAHPLRPTDPYAISKLLGEEVGRAFVTRGKLEVIALRPVFVLYPEMEGEVKARAANPAAYRGVTVGGPNPAGGGPAWHYVDPRDVARAFRLALEVEAPRFASYFISGPNTLAPEPTLERLRRVLGVDVPVQRPEVYARNPFAPLYDLQAARDDLGYEAEFDRRLLLYPAKAADAQ
ncbi:MAG: NAD(P)-dependent oxidoreductase [Pseudolabrys sp.]|nr:NAD(P)-dependent oxidoreductase [Pseudolabrys sp.]MDP2295077.1 NAD(P)-dependent oxidoreductase [Pseudolabrys sp.]